MVKISFLLPFNPIFSWAKICMQLLSFFAVMSKVFIVVLSGFFCFVFFCFAQHILIVQKWKQMKTNQQHYIHYSETLALSIYSVWLNYIKHY